MATFPTQSIWQYRHWRTSQLKPWPRVSLVLSRLEKLRVCPQGTPNRFSAIASAYPARLKSRDLLMGGTFFQFILFRFRHGFDSVLLCFLLVTPRPQQVRVDPQAPCRF